MQFRRLRFLIGLVVLSMLLGACATRSSSTSFPRKDMTFLVGYAAGGANDLISRALAKEMEKDLGRKILPKNLDGAGGAIALAELKTEKEKGHSFALYSNSLILLQYTGTGDVKMQDYQPVLQIAEDTPGLAVPASSPYKTLKEFVEAAKANPGKIRIANSGAGALWHIGAVQFAAFTGIKVEHVPYKGGAPSATALASGEIEATFLAAGEAKSLADAGKIRLLTVFTDKRSPLFPNVTTASEEGIKFVYPVWRGIFTQAGTDEAVVKRLHDSFKKAMETQAFVTFMKTSGYDIRYRDTKEFTELVKRQDKELYETLKSLGLVKK